MNKKRALNFPIKLVRKSRGCKNTTFIWLLAFGIQDSANCSIEMKLLNIHFWQIFERLWKGVTAEIAKLKRFKLSFQANLLVKTSKNFPLKLTRLAKFQLQNIKKSVFHSEPKQDFSFFLLSIAGKIFLPFHKNSMESFLRRYLGKKTLSIIRKKIKRFFTLDLSLSLSLYSSYLLVRPHFSLENSLHKLLHLQHSTRCFAPQKG